MVNTRPALQSLWKGTCTITIREEKQNPTNKRTEFDETPVYTDEPCKLSFETLAATAESSSAASVIQKAKLFLAPEVTVPAGSKITVTQNGKTADYERSGEPAVYTNHQELMLDLFKGWA